MKVQINALPTQSMNAENSDLKLVPTDKIKRNPENPRILFRQRELEELIESIRLYGVMVPISVYREGSNYVLIDGERRWLSALKLNKKEIPALIQEKPNQLTNLLLMFNIHSLREQWDLLTIAMKLPRVISLLEHQSNRRPSEKDISDKTGLPRGVIRRCKILIDLPNEYKGEILAELNKPKIKQKISEDLFIEMERALKTVERSMPQVIPDKDIVRRVLIDKYQKGIISNIVQFRMIPKITKAKKLEVDAEKASAVLENLFRANSYSIEKAYEDSVSEAYSEKDLLLRIKMVSDRLQTLDTKNIDADVIKALESLVQVIQNILRKAQNEI